MSITSTQKDYLIKELKDHAFFNNAFYLDDLWDADENKLEAYRPQLYQFLGRGLYSDIQKTLRILGVKRRVKRGR